VRGPNQISFAIHNFFRERGFVQLDAPFFTGNAVEGTTDLFETDFFGQPAYLSQSGQLYGEAMAMAHRKIYTFGPTFRAEKSKTRRHLSEFWMIEPEMAFYDLDMTMDLIEDFVRYVIRWVLEHCQFEFEQLGRDTEKLKKADQPFPRVTYDEAVKILQGDKEVNGQNTIETLENDLKEAQQTIEENKKQVKDYEQRVQDSNIKKKKRNQYLNKIGRLKAEIHRLEHKVENIPEWIESAKNFEYGTDFGGSDETVLTRLFDTPLQVYRWPKGIKAFYMKEDEEDSNFVKGVDLLAPEGFGEIVGGGERETNEKRLVEQINKHNLPMDAFEWYLDLRRYGSVTHSGFGLGLERFIAWVCDKHHVRETIPFPRMYGRLFP
jgi:asparaginyl-tRNA synthetase